MLQLPADKECVELFNEMVVEGAIIDVDHLGDDVLLDMWSGNFNRMPGTPRGIIAVLFNELGSLSGKKISIIGSRSKTTGRFLIPMLQHFNATVSMYHSRSIINHGEFRDCDAVISCVGSPRMIQASHLSNKRSQVLIDVGVGFIDGKVVGDFSEDVRGSHRYTPYVGGVGMLTRAMLIRNVLDSFLMIGGVK
jgi:methylenetetrahydrofolate dehydrogenase (NADP+)/methenyltetrahydrofolate cyclohydrolase